MEEKQKMGKGLAATNLTSLILSLGTFLLSDLLIALIVFGLSLPVSAYITSKILEKNA